MPGCACRARAEDCTDAERRGAPPPGAVRRLLVAGAVAVVVVAVDQATKSWAVHRLAHGSIHVVWKLDLELTYNSGAAFSLARGLGPGPGRPGRGGGCSCCWGDRVGPVDVHRGGARPGGGRRAGQPGRPGVPFPSRCSGGLHRAALLAHLQRGRLVRRRGRDLGRVLVVASGTGHVAPSAAGEPPGARVPPDAPDRWT